MASNSRISPRKSDQNYRQPPGVLLFVRLGAWWCLGDSQLGSNRLPDTVLANGVRGAILYLADHHRDQRRVGFGLPGFLPYNLHEDSILGDIRLWVAVDTSPVRHGVWVSGC
jgi:hypothetical protein